MESGRVRANGITLAYDAFGDPAHPPVVMVMGLGAPRWAWPDELCERIADAGRHVVRFDNRDAGESTRLSELGNPGAVDVLVRRRWASARCTWWAPPWAASSPSTPPCAPRSGCARSPCS